MTNVVQLFERVIVLKDGRTYAIPPDDPGVAFAERHPTVKLTPRLRDSRIYQTPDGPVIVRQELSGQADTSWPESTPSS